MIEEESRQNVNDHLNTGMLFTVTAEVEVIKAEDIQSQKEQVEESAE